MPIQLDKINPKFRQLVDQLCFSDRLDIDLSDFKQLLRENIHVHHEYLWDRLQKSTEIFWDQNQFWLNRFSFLFSLNEKALIKKLEGYLEKRMFNMIKQKNHVNILYDIEYVQFIEFCKVKHLYHESLLNVKNYLIDLPSETQFDTLITVIQSFIPFLFKDIDEYAEQLLNKIICSTRNFDFLVALEQYGYKLDREPIAQLAYNLITDYSHNNKSCRAFFYLINDKEVFALLKQKYLPSCRKKITNFLKACDLHLLEELHLRNIKNILELDSLLMDDLVELYAGKIYDRDLGHKTANIDKLIKLVKTCPQISPRKILAYLSSNNKVPDIKYIVRAFPDLKKLAAFV